MNVEKFEQFLTLTAMETSEHPLLGHDHLREMAQQLPHEDFVRRPYADGTTDSICLHCFSTVASTQSEAELRIAEADHDCFMRNGAAKQG